MISPATTLAQWLVGEFTNNAQAAEQPAWFVHLRLWHRPLPQRLQGNLALFAEQANVLKIEQAYRQRILMLQDKGNGLQGQYFAFKQPGQFQGAGQAPEKLALLQESDLIPLPGCVVEISQSDRRFHAQMRPGDRCRFEANGKVGQVVLGFEAEESQFLSYDRGVDPETEKPIWGALMGPYQFSKQQDYSGDLPL
ncbi:MAG: chromophore lyase CpcT/CpeT [Elainellaceae cyanobacterium]